MKFLLSGFVVDVRCGLVIGCEFLIVFGVVDFDGEVLVVCMGGVFFGWFLEGVGVGSLVDGLVGFVWVMVVLIFLVRGLFVV